MRAKHWALFIVFFIAFLLLCTFLLSSCSSMKKTTSSESSKVNITSVTKSDSASLIKKDSAVEKKQAEQSLVKKDSAVTRQEEEMEQEKITVNLAPVDRAKKTVNDFDGAPDIYDVTINGRQIKSSQPISNIVVENSKGKKILQAVDVKSVDSFSRSSQESSKLAIYDSTAKRRADSLSIAAETKKQVSTKKRSGFSVGTKVGLIIGALIFIFLGIKLGWFAKFFRWFFGLFRRKKDDKN